jgi:nitrite reductase (NADH) small subunit
VSWSGVARFDLLPVDRGVAALVGDHAVAVFRLHDGEVRAIDHVDPCTGVPVLARGIIASVGRRVVVTSPLHKQRFDLRTGECLDDPTVRVRTWPVLVVDGNVVIVEDTGTGPGGRASVVT